MLSIFERRIKKKDIGDFCQKTAMLLDTGYDACSAVQLLTAASGEKSHDHSADGVRQVAQLLLPTLAEGFSLHEAMSKHEKYFREYITQVEIGEASGKTGDVLNRIYEQIKNAGNVLGKLKAALAYPIFTLLLTFGAAAYLFTAIIPDMLSMLDGIGVGELPFSTRLVMQVGDWFKANWLFLAIVALGIMIAFFVYAKTIGKLPVSKISCQVPFIGKIIQNNAMSIFFRCWQQMLLSGAEMSVALSSAAESVPNLFIRKQLSYAQSDYAENGVAVYEALHRVRSIRELELQTIRVAMEGNRMGKTLGILAEDRNMEANKSVQAFTSAINPILMIIVGAVVGILVMAVYQPIISVSSSLA